MISQGAEDASADGGQGDGKKRGEAELGVQQGRHISAHAYKKGPAQRNQADKMGQEIKTERQQGVDATMEITRCQ